MHTRTYTYFAAFLALLVPASMYAAEIKSTPTLSSTIPETPFEVQIDFDPEGDSVNVIEGTVQIPAGVQFISVTSAGSPLSLWAQNPVYDASTRVVRFAGGVAGALPGKAHLMTIRASAPRGMYTFEPHAEAYMSDGAGTRIPVVARAEGISVGDTTISREYSYKTATSELVVEVGSDPSVFDGARFVSFYGGDTGSGIAYYEVAEGDMSPVRAENTYVLRSDASKVTVTAVAPDGTRISKSVSTTESSRGLVLVFVLGFVLALLIGLYFWRRRV